MGIRYELGDKAIMIDAKEVGEALGVSRNKAYEIIRQLNSELEEKDFYVIRGKVSKKYFLERIYGLKEGDEMNGSN